MGTRKLNYTPKFLSNHLSRKFVNSILIFLLTIGILHIGESWYANYKFHTNMYDSVANLEICFHPGNHDRCLEELAIVSKLLDKGAFDTTKEAMAWGSAQVYDLSITFEDTLSLQKSLIKWAYLEKYIENNYIEFDRNSLGLFQEELRIRFINEFPKIEKLNAIPTPDTRQNRINNPVI